MNPNVRPASVASMPSQVFASPKSQWAAHTTVPAAPRSSPPPSQHTHRSAQQTHVPHPVRGHYPKVSYHTPSQATRQGYQRPHRQAYTPQATAYRVQPLQQPVMQRTQTQAVAMSAQPEKHDLKLISVLVFFVFWILVSCTFLYIYMDKYLF